MDDPIAYFLTITAYGTWLPGDGRGWVDYHRGWQMPDSILELESKARMSDCFCLFDPAARRIVEAQIAETCRHRRWILHAVNCRTNHLHVVVSAPSVHPVKVRKDLKAWCTRRLKELCDPTRENWWAERGSTRWIWDEDGLATVILYATEAQDLKHLERA